MVPAQQVEFDLGNWQIKVAVPATTERLTMRAAAPLADPAGAILAALAAPIQSRPLAVLAAQRLAVNPGARAAVVISDNTRPVPYRGPAGILWPVIDVLLGAGFSADNITVLVATGTHRSMSADELAAMVDDRVLAAGIRILNHDSRDASSLRYVGTTRRGTRLSVNRTYLDADLKIVTGLVESHFMAGASGGRKAIVPGLIGEESTFVFHGPTMLAAPGVADLVLEGNPCHEEALEGALMAGADFMVNVTLDRQFGLTGVFAGDLVAAHRQAVEALTRYAGVPVAEPYDVAIIHAGRVGINHYQAAKAGVVGASLLRPGGALVIVAHHTDVDPVGSARYRTLLHLLKLLGPRRYEALLMADAWQFIPDQWEPQMWGKVLDKVGASGLWYCGTGLAAPDYAIIPGIDGNLLLPEGSRYLDNPSQLGTMASRALAAAIECVGAHTVGPLRIAALVDGPYAIPILR